MRRGALVALAVVVAVNAAVLTSVWRNRTRTADAEIWLDERELDLVRHDSQENSSTSLRFLLTAGTGTYDPAWVERHWLDQQALGELGFDVSIAPGDPRAERHYRTQLPRLAYVAFEIGGREWERHVARVREYATNRLRELGAKENSEAPRLRSLVDNAPGLVSRMVPVGAARDPLALRARYPDRSRVLILPAIIRVWRDPERNSGCGPIVHGIVSRLVAPELLVSRDQRAALDRLAPADAPRLRYIAGIASIDSAPRFAARVRVGPGMQAWVAEIRSAPQ